MAVSTEENEQTHQAASDSTGGNSDAKYDENENYEDGNYDEDGNEGMLMDISEMKATLKNMREMMASLKDNREMKEIAETIKSLVDLSQRGALDKDVVAPCVLKTSHSDGGTGTSPSGSGQQQLCSAPPLLQHASLQAQSGNKPKICVIKKSPNLTAHQHVVYKSLMYVPRNFKEAVDWLMAVRGDYGMKNLKALGAALYDFLVDKPVGKMEVPALKNVKKISKEFMEQKELKNMWPANEMLKRFSKSMIKNNYKLRNIFATIYDSDYKNVVNSKDVTAETVITGVINLTYGCERFLNHMKVPEQYKSAYSSEATWESSCSKKPEDCAVVLVGIAPMLWASVCSLNCASSAAKSRFPSSIAYKHMQELIEALGYVEPERRAGMTASYVGHALSGFGVETITFLYQLAGLWAFY